VALRLCVRNLRSLEGHDEPDDQDEQREQIRRRHRQQSGGREMWRGSEIRLDGQGVQAGRPDQAHDPEPDRPDADHPAGAPIILGRPPIRGVWHIEERGREEVDQMTEADDDGGHPQPEKRDEG